MLHQSLLYWLSRVYGFSFFFISEGWLTLLGTPSLLYIQIDSTITLVSWNVRGMNNKFKRAAVFQYLKQIRPHIILLQETHLDGSKILSLRRPWVQRALHSTYCTFARGVSVLISKAIPCTIPQMFSDPGGWYVAVVLDICYQKLLIEKMYLPPCFRCNYCMI